ncbi:MAG: glycoside hydrolase 100 family protein, partial [Trueperaceae bacterium]|nr:glycoside hydrolase 100 family protein [Trueperaceae bacterium]
MSQPTKGDPPPVPRPDAAGPAPNGGAVPRDALDAARDLVRSARIEYRGQPVGTAAAAGDGGDLNYGECFTRDFAVSAAAAFAQGETAMTADFVRLLSRLQARERRLDCFEPGAGLMPASFVVEGDGDAEAVVADFGQRAIGSVAPVDAALWWLLIVRAHGRASSDRSLAEDPTVRSAIERVLELYLAPRFEMTPALLVPDGAYAIDRRMGVYGHPLDVQVLFFAALRAARELLPGEHPLHEPLTQRLALLGHHVRTHYWLDAERLNVIYRYGVEEFGGGRANRYNVYADTIPTWVMRWMQRGGGYFVGNLGPARMDFRFFAIGNLLAITTGLSTPAQTRVALDTIADHRDDLWGQMPMKMVFPAVKGRQWRSTTGSDPKNAAWSYHNGGSWPWLVWLLAGAARRGDA